MTKITFTQKHIHAGVEYQKGDSIEVDAAAAEAIYAAGSAKRDSKPAPFKHADPPKK